MTKPTVRTRKTSRLTTHNDEAVGLDVEGEEVEE